MSAFDTAFKQIRDLVKSFKQNERHYKSAHYAEAHARKEFIDKFWIALGWDVNYEQQTNPYEQEVKVERGVAIGAAQRRADYAFYLAPNFHDVRFFVEAKKPSVEIATKENYFQLIRYGWNSETPLAVLTDFEQFHVLDCRYKPDIDNVLNRAVDTYHYSDYADREKFAKIYWLFSHEAVDTGSLEKFAKELPKPRGKARQRGMFPGGYQSIDESFLAELDGYRAELAQSFKKRNPKLDSETLTELTQRTLDRLVFLRFLEDKGIEPSRRVQKFAGKGAPWEDFIAASRRLDGIYNGIVYREHDILDSNSFHVDEDAFADICNSLAHAESPYDFNAIPIHILGSIYERFLGKVIVATPKRVRVEEKPEVRKAGGVYYTPEYIVRYIVENTIGKLIDGKTPEEIAEMRFADIACGSGSFLLGAFDRLLKYHGQYYNDHPDKAREGDCIERDGKLYPSLAKRREILLNNIYGVDIDAQAVEVCQLSLYLRLLEEETEATAQQYLLEFQHVADMKRLLPDLSRNIICGNSLIGRDILNGKFEFANHDERKLNPMNFQYAFPDAMKRGGFDAIIGNPPYIRIQILQKTSPVSVEYLSSHYGAASKGNYDIYVVFVERALSLLNPRGKLGYILPHKFFNSQYGWPLRQLLSQGQHVSHIVHFGAQQIFEGATTYTCLLFLDKGGAGTCRYVKVTDLDAWQKGNGAEEGTVAAHEFTGTEWGFTVGRHALLCERLRKTPLKLGDVADIFVGLQTSADDVFILDAVDEKRRTLRLRSKILGAERTLEKGLLHPLVSGTDVLGYGELPRRQYIIFPYRVSNERAELLDFDAIEKRYPKTAAYLLKNKMRLAEREHGQFNDREWYRFGRNQNLGIQSRVKLCVPRLVSRLHAAWDAGGDHFLDNVDVGGVTLKPAYRDQGFAYLLALLNSRLLAWYFPFISAPFRGGWMSANRQFLSRLPFRPINFSETKDKSAHGKIVAKVGQIMEAKKRLAKAKTDSDKAYYERTCNELDSGIDRLVYDLYGLTEEEIAIVEGSQDRGPSPTPDRDVSGKARKGSKGKRRKKTGQKEIDL
ncbi:MAG: N-6 DNA methylase [Planctomycetota bacterium]